MLVICILCSGTIGLLVCHIRARSTYEHTRVLASTSSLAARMRSGTDCAASSNPPIQVFVRNHETYPHVHYRDERHDHKSSYPCIHPPAPCEPFARSRLAAMLLVGPIAHEQSPPPSKATGPVLADLGTRSSYRLWWGYPPLGQHRILVDAAGVRPGRKELQRHLQHCLEGGGGPAPQASPPPEHHQDHYRKLLEQQARCRR